jgi:predicted DNA-binding transcriptional regulator AlpA
MNEELLHETQAAAFLSLSARSLQRYRTRGGGPEYVRLGVKRVGYRRSALLAWAGRSHTSTTAEGYVSPLAAKRRRQATSP